MTKKQILLSALLATSMAASAQSLYFPLDGNLTETVSGTSCTMNGVRALPYATGVNGQCLRMDGYSNYLNGSLSYTGITPEAMTFSIWIAPETYPMMDAGAAQVVPTYSMVAGNLDTAAKTGFGLMLSSQGGYKFSCYIGGQIREYLVNDDIIPLGKWSNIVVTLDNASQQMHIYRNGNDAGAMLSNGKNLYKTLTIGSSSFLLGKSREELMSGSFHINTFNGLIDEVRIDNTLRTAEEIKTDYISAAAPAVEAVPVTSLLSDTEYGYLRPQFHGMPAHGWTNENHGLVYYNGKYHVFFQKNGNGPYMARLHWGHITSTDLLNWSEEPVAIAPGASANNLEANDGKGCWSGCIFTDADINDGKPTILYTGVSNAKAFIWQAAPKDDNLLEWEKQGILISSNGTPCTTDASDDFRDPYFFTANGSKYIIIGTSSKVGVGTCLLYKKNADKWDYQGLFFSGTSKTECGRFWEMPNVTDLGNGKYLFTCTPLDMANGVKCIYWIGTIGADGKFTPDQTAPQTFEASGTSKDGYGLLSPTIYNHDGKLLTLGIVPDKVSTITNYNWGWAHNYSLPRELSLSTDSKSIVEKPLASLANYRSAETTEGRQIEMLGTFQYSSAQQQGFRFLKNGEKYAQLSIGGGKLTLDLTKIDRQIFDGIYNGKYETSLNVPEGEQVTIDAILDGSIIDIFFSSPSIEGKAFSVRLYPTDKTAFSAEAFSSLTHTAHIWSIDTKQTTAIGNVSTDTYFRSQVSNGYYNLLGQRVDSDTKGLVIHNGSKYVRH